MLDFLRRFSKSPIGVAILGLIMIAFVVTLYEGRSGGLGLPGGEGGSVATAGGRSIGAAEAARRVQTQLDAARQDQPGLDMATFIAQGGVEQTVDQMINAAALEAFAKDQGMVASKRLVDGAIASIPAFRGPTGRFDRATFLAILAQRKIPEAQLRIDFAREALTRQLLLPAAGAARQPLALVEPYAALLLEGRKGSIVAVPGAAFGGPAPSAAQISAFYAAHRARYTLPERRIVRYALFDRGRFEGKVAPSEAEIAAAYKANAAAYAARETRGLTQVIVPDQARAEALAAKARGGASLAEAARAIGLEAVTVPPTDRAALTKTASEAVAAAAFGAARGAIAPVARSGLGFHVIRVDSITAVPARSLADARAELTARLVKEKEDAALADLVAKIEDGIDGGATFDDVARKYGLTATATPAVTASGQAPDQPGYRAPPELAPVLAEAFKADPDDDAAVAPLGADNKAFALYHLDRVVPAAPRPLDAIRAEVTADTALDLAAKAAKKAADAIAAAVNAGKPVAAAVAAAGVRLPAPQPVAVRRMDLARQGERAPPPLAMLFSLAPKRARVLAMPNDAGWYVVQLDSIEPGDAARAKPLVAATQAQLARVTGDEYVAQLVNAMKAQVGTSRNASGIAALKRSLSGASAAQ